MLRPATPLTILLVAALALLVISVISAPITKSIYLGKAGDTIYGVLGKCTGDKCTSASIGYDVTADGSTKFSLPDSVRQSLSKTLILHPVAAAVTLVMLIMAGVSHIHAAAHSSRYLLALFLFTLLAFLIALAATIISIVLFMPHIAFGTWLVLAAAIILLISSVVTFTMRKAMVGRKARRRKIAENAEMSGENYYNREDAFKPVATMSGANSGADGLPVFASYERNRPKDDQVSDERIPLTQVRTTERSPATNTADLANAGPSRSISQDRYGGQPGQGAPYGAQAQGHEFNGRPSRGAMPGYRGGGAPRGGRGGYGGYGAPVARRDSYGRGGMGPRGRGGPYGQPRDGYNGAGMAGAAGGAMAGAAMARGGRQGYGQQPSRSGPYDTYNNQPVNGQGEYSNWGSQSNQGHANTEADLPRAESPPPLPAEVGSAPAGFGPAAERAGGPSEQHSYGAAPANTALDNDSEVAGMVHMQQGHPIGQLRPGYVSDGSKYSTDEYVPPRAAWNQGSGRGSPRGQSPVHGTDRRPAAADYRGPTSPLAGGPSNYYEDVEPRFGTSGPHAGAVTTTPGPIYEDAHAMDGSRSPAGSERSNFTSVSQRGVNPRWNPHQHPMPGNGARRAVQQRHDMLLDNPDFQLAGGRAGKPKHGNPSGLVPGSAYPTQI